MIIDIQPLKRKDILEMDQMFLKQGWPSRQQLLMEYLNEQEAGERCVLLAKINNKTAGYLTLVPLAKHGPFKGLYPEIADFNVFESYQKQGVGSQLLKAAEEKAREIAAVVTLGGRFTHWLWIGPETVCKTRLYSRWVWCLVQ